VRTYLNELLWREFAHHVLWEGPELVSQPFRAVWRSFPWRHDDADLQAWQMGRTGYPVVDAAAQELLATGFVHNRARMVAASFLTKHLMLDWRLGEAHYRRLLVESSRDLPQRTEPSQADEHSQPR
jgi:deoxyribodipyrimidine photo-lyase